jgi:FAD/FMN-containing dehydrogenase
MQGRLIRPGSADYAAASRLYNPRFDGKVKPAAVARCVSADDVAAGVRFAATNGLPFALRSGGHSYGGWSTSPGLVVDVGGLNKVTVDTAHGIARIGAGARLAEVYAALSAKGVAIAGGSCPTVGITGLALGGGLSVLNRAFGLTCDAIRGVDLVTADGVHRAADADLLWALKGGGGGSFGAVTSLTMAVRPAPKVATYYFAWDIAHAAEVVDAWQKWIASADPKLWSTCKVLSSPATGAQRAIVAGTWIGVPTTMDGQFTGLLTGLPKPATTSKHSYSYAQAMLFEAGCSTSATAASCIATALGPRRQAFAATSSVLYDRLPPAGIQTLVDQASAAIHVSGLTDGGVSLDGLGGEITKVAPNATAFGHREALATAQYTASYQTGSAEPFDAYVRGFRTAMRPWCGDWAYVSYADPSIPDPGPAYWSANYERLRAVKGSVDPHNLFSFPQAVELPS